MGVSQEATIEIRKESEGTERKATEQTDGLMDGFKPYGKC